MKVGSDPRYQNPRPQDRHADDFRGCGNSGKISRSEERECRRKSGHHRRGDDQFRFARLGRARLPRTIIWSASRIRSPPAYPRAWRHHTASFRRFDQVPSAPPPTKPPPRRSKDLHQRCLPEVSTSAVKMLDSIREFVGPSSTDFPHHRRESCRARPQRSRKKCPAW